MSEININNFKAGLDTRRSILSSQPGTLMVLNNAHINEGGEVEKRKAFFRQPLPSNTFGLLATGEEILTFGSKQISWTSTESLVTSPTVGVFLITTIGSNPINVGDYLVVSGATSIPELNGVHKVLVGGTAYFSSYIQVEITGATSSGPFGDTLTISSYFPSPIVYQQLTHPILNVEMMGVTTATLFNESAFVVTTWSNGDVLGFYNGQLVTDFTTGELNNISPSAYAMVTALIAQINASGIYTATQDALPTFLSFTITAGTANPGVNTVGTTGIGYNFGRIVFLNGTGTDVFDLLNGGPPIDWITSNVQTATNVVTAINTNPYGFVASNSGGTSNQVNVTPPALDDNGSILGVQGPDSIDLQPGGNVQLFIPPNSSTFEVFSIPTTTDVNPYTVADIVTNAVLSFRLVSGGVPATLPLNAAGQFTLTQGGPNTNGTGTVTVSASVPIVNNDTLTIGGVVYTFVTFLTNTPNQIVIGSGGTISIVNTNTLSNFVAAINGLSGLGTLYSQGTSQSILVTASAVVARVTTLTSVNNGTPGNIAISKVSAALTLSGATLTGGTNTNQVTQISVGAVNLLLTAVPFNQTANQTSNDIVTAINAFQGTSGFNAVNNANVVIITAINAGASINEALISITCAGNVCIASCFFFVSATTGQTVIGITAAGTAITTGTLTFKDGGHPTETIAQFCGRIVANIVAHGLYCAFSSANQIWISPVITTSADGIIDIETGTGTATLVAGTGAALVANGNISLIPFSQSDTLKVSINSPNSAIVSVTGGVPPYTYNWLWVSGAHNAIVVSKNLNTQGWKVVKPNKAIIPTGTEVWNCVVTDNLGAIINVPFSLFY